MIQTSAGVRLAVADGHARGVVSRPSTLGESSSTLRAISYDDTLTGNATSVKGLIPMETHFALVHELGSAEIVLRVFGKGQPSQTHTRSARETYR